ncbi:hypothetical protein LTR08_000207 [Meristemomyces frigidus]|nr:hypothetical protein LTR08_000207 [Meristemomyces frigidus]
MARLISLLLLALLFLSTLSSSSTVSLPSYPLAVKSPYLSTWVPGSQLTNAATAQPEFWAGQSLTWPVLARVNGVTYSLFGKPHGVRKVHSAKTVRVSFTSSHTLVELTAGGASFTLDFFSPVLPGTKDYVRQSLPYSYLTVTATSTSRRPVLVQVLSAIDQTWTAQNGAADLNYTSSGSATLFEFYNPQQIPYTEVSDMATYGSVIFATTSGPKVTRACDTAANIHRRFIYKGDLVARKECRGTDLAALSSNLGYISTTSTRSVTFAVGFDRVQAINYLGKTQTGYYRTKWPTPAAAVDFFLQDYGNVLKTSNAFDQEVPIDSLDATPQAFIKEISSDGNLNTVDIIFQTWPIFISLNPTYIRLLFQPIMSYLETGDWPEPWMIHDLGTAYPNATGHNDGQAESMPLFETSSLFILFYAYQKYTGDASWARQYLPLLEQYAAYLVDNSLYPASQLISVDAIPAQPNQTALAIQSTIGLKAASLVTGNRTYATVAESFANTIYNQALGLNGRTVEESTHFTYYYGQDSTWNVVFAAYSDVLLELNTFPSTAWSMQSDWYLTQLQALGLPFAGPSNETAYTGSPITWGLSDWSKSDDYLQLERLTAAPQHALV